MMNDAAAFTLELAQRFDGYLVPLDAEIVALRDAGRITTKYAGEGFVIARAVPAPPPLFRARNGKWIRRHPIGAFPREAKRGISA
jgi:hypothetical protein